MKKTSCSVCACRGGLDLRGTGQVGGVPESRSTIPRVGVTEQRHRANDNGMLSRVVLQQLRRKKKKKGMGVQVFADGYEHCQSLDKLADLTRQKNKQICKHIYEKAELEVKNEELKLAMLNPSTREQQLQQQIYELQGRVSKLNAELQEKEYKHKEEVERLRKSHQAEISTMRNSYGKSERKGEFASSSMYQPATVIENRQPVRYELRSESPRKYQAETLSPSVVQYQSSSQVQSGGGRTFGSALQNNNVARYSPEKRIQNNSSANTAQTSYARQFVSPSQQTSNSPRSYSPSKQATYGQTANSAQTLYSPLSPNGQTVFSTVSTSGQASNLVTTTYSQPRQSKEQGNTRNVSPGFSNVFASGTTTTQSKPVQYTSGTNQNNSVQYKSGTTQNNQIQYANATQSNQIQYTSAALSNPIQYTSATAKGAVPSFTRETNSPPKYDSSKNTTSNTYIYKQDGPKENAGNRVINSTYQQYTNAAQYAPKRTVQTEVSPRAVASNNSKTVTFASSVQSNQVQSNQYSKGEGVGQQGVIAKGVTAKQIDDIYKRYCLTDA